MVVRKLVATAAAAAVRSRVVKAINIPMSRPNDPRIKYLGVRETSYGTKNVKL